MFTCADNSSIIQCQLLRPISWYYRWDVLPFFLVHLIQFGVFSVRNCIVSFSTTLEMAFFFGLPIALILQILLYLISRWSVASKRALGFVYISRTQIDSAEYVILLETVSLRNFELSIVKLLRRSDKAFQIDPKFVLLGTTIEIQNEYFEYQNKVYILNSKSGLIEMLSYPTRGNSREFLNWTGYDQDSVNKAFFKWGWNKYEIPLPSFFDMYIDHIVAPFFAFQVVCLFLWSLDDYWYYSLVTLLMLFLFEGVLCKQRHLSLQMLRNMQQNGEYLLVKRDGIWTSILSEELVPGDIIEIAFRDSSQRGVSHSHNVLACDALLISGRCVVNEAIITGESIPQIKESLRNAENNFVDLERGASSEMWKKHLILAGTKILQHECIQEKSSVLLSPPNRGCIAIVVRTGFGTTQGNLMRKILSARESVSTSSNEIFYFIGVLVFFAAVASGMVLHTGLQDESRNQFKLVLHCVMIITSVIPPELPMELSLALTNSVCALNRNLIFCTETFRIPFAGKLDVLCFDKTGTLTRDEMIFCGIVGAQYAPRVFSTNDNNSTVSMKATEALSEEVAQVCMDVVKSCDIDRPQSCPDIILCIMASCNALHENQTREIVGDPLEIATFNASGFRVISPSLEHEEIGFRILEHSTRDIILDIKRRYLFSSALKRMSVVVNVQSKSCNSENASGMWVFTKGAPEVIEDLLLRVPVFYGQTFRHHMNSGKRVLVLAGKRLFHPDVCSISRAYAESGLFFMSFLLFDSALKDDSKSVIKDLRDANHRILMITGDSVYTAVDVGRRIGLLSSKLVLFKPALFLMRRIQKESMMDNIIFWCNETSEQCAEEFPFDESKVIHLETAYVLCVTGPAMQFLADHCSVEKYHHIIRLLASSATFFARVSPFQKENLIVTLNDAGYNTLMCGDGTNDVGALKAAHVGISIVNDPKFEKNVSASIEAVKSIKQDKVAQGKSRRDRIARAFKEKEEQERDPTIVKLGDASIAAPFTARRTSIDSVVTLICQGRCTLVTTIQIFKIVALNCLVSAYMMSALYFRGLKQGDIQMTVIGLITSGLFFFISQSKPVSSLAQCKPPSSVFAPSITMSIICQFFVHLGSLVATLSLCEIFTSLDDSAFAVDGKFQPNLINSSMFLLSAVMHVNNFVINFRGQPFTQSINENIPLLRSVQAIYLSIFVVLGGQLEPLNDFLQLVRFPSPQFQGILLIIMLINFVLAFAVESISRKFKSTSAT